MPFSYTYTQGDNMKTITITGNGDKNITLISKKFKVVATNVTQIHKDMDTYNKYAIQPTKNTSQRNYFGPEYTEVV